MEPLLCVVEQRSDVLAGLAGDVVSELGNTPENRAEVKRLDGVCTLVKALGRSAVHADTTIGILLALISDDPVVMVDVIHAGVFSSLLRLLGNGAPSTRVRAMQLLACIGLHSPRHKYDFVREGALPVLFRLLRDGSKTEREQPMDMLVDLAGYSAFRSQIIDARGRDVFLTVEQRSNGAEKLPARIARRILENPNETLQIHPLHPSDLFSEIIGGLDNPDTISSACTVPRGLLQSLRDQLCCGYTEAFEFIVHRSRGSQLVDMLFV